jgi:hypothetical protein
MSIMVELSWQQVDMQSQESKPGIEPESQNADVRNVSRHRFSTDRNPESIGIVNSYPCIVGHRLPLDEDGCSDNQKTLSNYIPQTSKVLETEFMPPNNH